MDKRKTISATLNIQMYVDCPNEDCLAFINLLNENDTDDYEHDKEGFLLRQMFPNHGSNEDFECKNVTCTACKTTFNVHMLNW